MYADWIFIYRSYTTAELQTELTTVKEEQSVFTQQSQGSKSFARDIRELRDKLFAITYVLRERGAITPVKPSINIGEGVVDFSAIQ